MIILFPNAIYTASNTGLSSFSVYVQILSYLAFPDPIIAIRSNCMQEPIGDIEPKILRPWKCTQERI